jgi:hypothetical protein
MNLVYLKRFQDHMVAQNEYKSIQEVIQVYEKALSYWTNSTNLKLWEQYLAFMNQLEDVYAQLPGENVNDLETQRESLHRAVLEKAILAVGFFNLESCSLWEQYIDFETTQNNLPLVNVLCFLACETPLSESERLVDKYLELIDTNFESIFESSNAPGADKDVPSKF